MEYGGGGGEFGGGFLLELKDLAIIILLLIIGGFIVGTYTNYHDMTVIGVINGIVMGFALVGKLVEKPWLMMSMLFLGMWLFGWVVNAFFYSQHI